MKDRAKYCLEELQLLEKQIMGENPSRDEIGAFKSTIQKIWKDFCEDLAPIGIELNVNEKKLENMYTVLNSIINTSK